MINEENKYNLIKFEDGEFSLDVNVSPTEDTVWLTQAQMALLFDVDRTRIARHIQNIYSVQELLFSATCAENAQVQIEGNRIIKRKVKYYNLDMIISVGYRVNSKRGILFRKWATTILKQYM
ncbi:MAG: virulence RhuM family protein, partial [Anaeroplasmataceae bacterium]|nr:virulence RhuM family protein [Anaeroplasmataceae bacterium]